MKVEIKGIIRNSLLDWDGKIVSTLYVPACNFRCPFCHNWELILHPERFETHQFEEIEASLLKEKDFLDGVCITGGEPTLYEDLPQFIEKIRNLKMKIKLDTNGTNPKMLERLLKMEVLDYIAMDIKAPLDKRYEKLAGVPTNCEKVERSIELIIGSDVDYEFRTTIVPTLLKDDDIFDIIETIKGAKKYVIQQFMPDNVYSKRLQKVTPYEFQEISEIIKKRKNYVKEIKIRGANP